MSQTKTQLIANSAVVDAAISANAEVAVSKLADGNARQLLQTDAAGTGVEWTDNVDLPGTLTVTGATTLKSDVTLNAQSDLRFADADSSNWVAFQAPTTVTSNVTWTLPSADGTSGQLLTTNGTGTLSWVTVSTGTGDVVAANNNAFTGANTFYNATGQTFSTATGTNDGLVLKGRAGGTSSYRVSVVPGILTANRTYTLPDADGTAVLTGANSTFSGANTFYNGTGQTFGTGSSTEDGIILAGRAGGTTSLRVTLQPGTLTTSRTLTLPDVTGTVFTNQGGTIVGDVTLNAQSDLRFADADSSNWVAFQAPGTVTSNVTWTLPAADGSNGQVLSTNGTATLSWASVLTASANNTFTGANTFYNNTGQTFGTATSTQDGIILAGRAGGTLSYRVTFTPGTLSGNRTLTLPDINGTLVTTGDSGTVSGTMIASNVALAGSPTTTTQSTGNSTTAIATTAFVNAQITASAATVGAANAFTGANTFYNSTGQTFGTGTSTQDGIILAGRAGGTTSLRVTLQPGTLTANRTLTLPDVSGTVITTGDTGSVSNTMLAGSIADSKLNTISTAGKVNGAAITSGNISTSGSIATTSTVAVGQSSAATNTDLDVNGTYAQTVQTVSALNIDCSTGNYFTKSIGSTNSTFTVSNVPSSRSYSFVLKLTATTGLPTFFSGVIWPDGVAPTLTANKTHLFMFSTDDGGTTWRASSVINYAS